MEQTCGNCKFSLDDAGSKWCRRYPPSVFPVPTPDGKIGWTSNSTPVREFQWCGEWSMGIVTTNLIPNQ